MKKILILTTMAFSMVNFGLAQAEDQKETPAKLEVPTKDSSLADKEEYCKDVALNKLWADMMAYNARRRSGKQEKYIPFTQETKDKLKVECLEELGVKGHSPSFGLLDASGYLLD